MGADRSSPELSEKENPPAYIWTLQFAWLIIYPISAVGKAIQTEFPKRTQLGKVLLVVEVSIILGVISLLSPFMLIISSNILFLSLLFFVGRVLIRVLNWVDMQIDEIANAVIRRATPLLTRFIEWYCENAYKEESEYSV